MSNKSKHAPIGSPQWNDQMFGQHPTPYSGIAGWIERRRVQSIIQAIKRNVTQPNFSLLEIGCEAGNLLGTIARHFPKAHVTGFDISKEALALAQTNKNLGQATFVQGDITQPFESPVVYDFIVCSETLEHIPDYQLAIKNIAMAGSEDTIFIITVPLEALKNRVKKLLNKLGLFNLFFQGIEKGMSEWHVNDFSKADFLKLLSADFEVVFYKQIWGLHQIVVAKRPSP